MKHKTLYKLLFDAVMGLLFVLMYDKHATGMSFHEWGGLVLLSFFIVHILFNYRWVVSITKRLFDRTLPKKIRVGYVLNVSLLFGVVLMAISSAMISQTIFSFKGSNVWKTVHLSTAAALIILLGIHVGLHYRMIAKVVEKHLRLPKALVLAVAFALFIFGLYNLSTTQYGRWLSLPFTSSTLSNGMHKGSPSNAMSLQKPEAIASSPVLTVLQFSSISFLFISLTVVADKLLAKKKRRKSIAPR
jgi:hypothetical protein